MSNVKIYAKTIEDEARKQIEDLASLAAFSSSVIRIMPDCHSGKGCVIGFTADLGDKTIPNIVGVDIGCGMLATKIDCSNPDLEKLDQIIKTNIPSGMDVNEQVRKELDTSSIRCLSKINNRKNRIPRSLGTLGGGNHFIELDKSEDGSVYLVVHTGSRNLGKQIAEIYQYQAIEDLSNSEKERNEIENMIKTLKEAERGIEIPNAIKEIKNCYAKKPVIPNDFCYLEGKHREDYLFDMRLAQEWAKANRRLITDTILDKMGWNKVDQFESVHNYIDDKDMVRKGAISAFKGEKVIIPLNMRDGTIIGIGKGNKDWNYSAPHGAGRKYSRSLAKKTLSLEEFQKEMKGIYTTTANISTIDEAPMAYKNSDEILEAIQPTVEVETVIKPIYNFKAA